MRYEMSIDNGGDEIIDAADVTKAIETAKDWIRDGDYGDVVKTIYISGKVVPLVTACRNCNSVRGGTVMGGIRPCDCGEPDTTEVRDDDGTRCVTVRIDPDEPGCEDGDHDWHSPRDSAWASGHGGVRNIEVCRTCGLQRITDTGDTDPSDGSPIETVRYETAARAAQA